MNCGNWTPCGCQAHDGPLDKITDWGLDIQNETMTDARQWENVRCRRCGIVGRRC